MEPTLKQEEAMLRYCDALDEALSKFTDDGSFPLRCANCGHVAGEHDWIHRHDFKSDEIMLECPECREVGTDESMTEEEFARHVGIIGDLEET